MPTQRTVRVTLLPNFVGKRGQWCESQRGWLIRGWYTDTETMAFQRVETRKGSAWNVALSFCKRHGHGLLREIG